MVRQGSLGKVEAELGIAINRLETIKKKLGAGPVNKDLEDVANHLKSILSDLSRIK